MRQFKNSQNITDRNSISINNYLRDVNRYPMITMEEEVELARQIRKGGIEGRKAKQRLVEANLRFVVSVANQYHQKNMELADLISEGNIGLIKAAERFDDTKGFKFISYAVWWIRQCITTAIAEFGNVIRVPQNQQALIQQYKILSNETMQTEQRKPTAEEFAAFADIDLSKAQFIIGITSKTVSTDSTVADDSDTTVGEMISSGSKTDDIVDRESLHADILACMDNILSLREKEIVKRSFGIDNHEQSLEDISLALGLSRERVRQIREKAVVKMKESDSSHLLYRYLG